MSQAATLGPTIADSIVVVSDAGPLICLARLDLLGVLPRLFSEVQVPAEVIRECLARPGNDDTVRIEAALQAGWLLACQAPRIALKGLEAGECAAIARAAQLGAVLLVDERAARAIAAGMGLRVTGTVGLLIRARKRGLVGPLKPLIEMLRAGGQRLAQPLVELALREVGEDAS